MTPISISGLTAHQQTADAKAQATPEQLKVARDFEAIFLRKLLSSMEKTGGSSGIGGSGSGASVYRSMMVGAIADSAAESGGIGLSDMILQAMLRSQGVAAPPAPSGAAQPGASHEVSQAGAPATGHVSSRLTPAGDAANAQTSLNLVRGGGKDEASRGAPKGGGR